MYSIGAVARQAGISPHTIRAWEKRYQLDLANKNDRGQRRYTKLNAEHIQLLAKLTQQGFQIRDLASMSLERLNQFAIENQLKQVAVNQPVVLIHGTRLERLVETHALLYSGYLIERLEDNKTNNPSLILLDLASSVQESTTAELTRLQQQHPSSEIHVFYSFAAKKYIEPLQQQGIHFLKNTPNRETLFNVLQERSKHHRLHLAAMKKAEAFLATFRSRPEPLYDSAVLERYLHDLPKLACECPNHLSELSLKLHDFQRYTKVCLENDNNDARLHQIIYDYTSYARQLMEQALTLVLQAEGVIPINDQVELMNLFNPLDQNHKQ